MVGNIISFIINVNTSNDCFMKSSIKRFRFLDYQSEKSIYQSPLILTELFQHNLINVSYLTACYLYQAMMKLHFLNDVANDSESTQK